MPNVMHFGLFFVCHSHFPHICTFPHPLPIIFPYLSPLRFPKIELNKKLSYRGQNALSVLKTHERNIRTGQMHNVLELSVRLFVRLFVCSSSANL